MARIFDIIEGFWQDAIMTTLAAGPPQSAIRVEGLTKRFGDVVALNGVDLSVPGGSVLGLLGPNGAGKTTVVRILTTVINADGGYAEILGIDLGREPDRVRRRIGLAGQYAAVDPNLTGRENLRLIGRLTRVPRAAVGRRVDELLVRFGLEDAADRLARTYSGGMRRRLDLAAALVHRPPVLFLDEPTTGLDPQGRQDLWAVIEELAAEGTTLLLCTQYLEEADRLADDIVVVDHGRVVASGSPSELKARLGGTVIDLALVDERAARRAGALLGPFAVRPPERAGRTVHLEVANGPRRVVEALGVLDREGLDAESLAVREPSLDDVFLTLTGRRTDAAPDDELTDLTQTRGAA
jgi:daunorubicin resistance ABC transporter ATP-binding subunit